MNIRTLVLSVLFFFPVGWGNDVFAQKKTNAADKEEIVILEHPANRNAIFKLNDTVKYSIDLKSTYRNAQYGKITYAIYELNGRLIGQHAYPVSIPAGGNKKVQLDLPAQRTGFYKVNFMLNVTDDDDTVRRVFGVDTANIHPEYKKPVDFDTFWDNARKELAQVQPDFKMTEMPKLGTDNDQVYLVEMRSLGNLTVRGWLVLPKDRKPGEKLPITLALPGYGGEMLPFKGIGPGTAYLGLNVRGLGNSRDVIHLQRDEYISYGIEDKNKYIFRGAIMDCIRAVDFICSRPELDSTAIFTTGGSMGAYLSLALASLDHRVALCSADNPVWTEMRYSEKTWPDVFPINTLKDFARKRRLDFGTFLNTWDYYDLKNFVPHIKCPVTVGIGLLDNFMPPTTQMAMYNEIRSQKKLFVFPNKAHEVGPEMGAYVSRWFYNKLHIYQKWLAFNKTPQPVKTETVTDADMLKGETIIIKERPLNKQAIFKTNSTVTYNIDIKSTYKTSQSGNVSYLVTTADGKFITRNTVPVTVAANELKMVQLDMPGQTAGFYKVNFMVNLTDYDDTIRRVFGVDTADIRDNKGKPANFDTFWQNAKAELAKVAPHFKVTEQPDLEHGNDKMYLIEMQSLDNITIRGYMSLPADRKEKQRLPVSVYLPGYGAQAQPMNAVSGMAFVSLSVRGQELSNDEISPDREDFITEGIEDKNKYILRGAVMDCIRLLDFIDSRPELDTTAIYVTGASMGGYFTIALAALDKRVTICSANNPTFSNFRGLPDIEFPMSSIKRYADANSETYAGLLDNLDYFDLKNFASGVKCPVVAGIGLLDHIAPPTTELQFFNKITAQKKLMVFPESGHDVGPAMGAYVGKWVYRQLHVFDKWRAFNPGGTSAKTNELASGSSSIAIIEHPEDKDALFKGGIGLGYDVDLKNNFFTKQDTKFSWAVYTSAGKLIKEDTIRLSLEPRSIRRVRINIPVQKMGFYNINMAVNAPGYNDSVKRAFGVDAYNIHELHPRPADFDHFWEDTRQELAAVAPNFRMTEKPELEKPGEQIYLIEMQSLDNITVRGWLTLPKDRWHKDKFPVYLSLPGDGEDMQPNHGISNYAYISFNPRGVGNSRDVIKPESDEYITYNIEDKNKFIYRGAIMDVVRMIDFINSRKDLFYTDAVFLNGVGLGAYLALATAGIDHRVSLLAAANPEYIELRSPYYKDKWPVSAMADYADVKSVSIEQIMNNFDYFDLKNFVSKIQCQVLIGVGMLDPIVPPVNSMIMYNNIKAPKRLFIYPTLPHEVDPEFSSFAVKWMMGELGQF